MFNHIPELLGLLVLGLIIFGPKRMIEAGSQAGRMLRELRDAMKDMSWNPLEEGSSSGAPTTLSRLSQLAQDLTAPRGEGAAPAAAPHVVESTAQPTSEPHAES